MDIFTNIRKFYDFLEQNPMSSSQIALWYALLHTNNKAGWAEWFTVASQVLSNRAGMTRASLIRARNALKQAGLIDFKPNGTMATSYTLFNFDTTTEQKADTKRTESEQKADSNRTKSDTINKTNTKTKIKTNKTPHNPPRGAEERFDRFWSAYPKKVAKPAARKAFDRLKPDDGLAGLMLAALEKHKATDQWTRDGGQFIPNPATWLSQRRWEDDLPTGVKGRQVSAQQYQQRDYTDHDLQGDTDWLAVAQQEAGMRGATP